MSDICISCNTVVTPRQHAVSCDVCDRWQHRICGTGKKKNVNLMHFYSIGICGTDMFIYLIHEFIYHKKGESIKYAGQVRYLFIYLFI